MKKDEFRRYATGHLGLNGHRLDDYVSHLNGYASSAHHSGSEADSLRMEGYVSPTIIEERQLNVATMDVFSRLMMDRIIFLGASIYDDVANIIQAQLLFLESADSSKDIRIYINSPGGSVYAGLGIYDTMQLIAPTVSTICTGMAASMAAILLAAGEKGKRTALPHSRVMIHQPMGGAQGQASDIEITARQILQLRQELYKILSEHSGRDIKQIEKDADRDYWLTAHDAVKYGLVDSIVTSKKKKETTNGQ